MVPPQQLKKNNREGCRPEEVIYCAIIHGYYKHGKVEVAKRVFSNLRGRKLLTETDMIVYKEMLIDHMKKQTADLVLARLKFFRLESDLSERPLLLAGFLVRTGVAASLLRKMSKDTSCWILTLQQRSQKSKIKTLGIDTTANKKAAVPPVSPAGMNDHQLYVQREESILPEIKQPGWCILPDQYPSVVVE
ncbi:hypothetical protein ACFE04_011353 [Oxalis oulophora]